jgi:hypothetical protein
LIVTTLLAEAALSPSLAAIPEYPVMSVGLPVIPDQGAASAVPALEAFPAKVVADMVAALTEAALMFPDLSIVAPLENDTVSAVVAVAVVFLMSIGV